MHWLMLADIPHMYVPFFQIDSGNFQGQERTFLDPIVHWLMLDETTYVRTFHRDSKTFQGQVHLHFIIMIIMIIHHVSASWDDPHRFVYYSLLSSSSKSSS